MINLVNWSLSTLGTHNEVWMHFVCLSAFIEQNIDGRIYETGIFVPCWSQVCHGRYQVSCINDCIWYQTLETSLKMLRLVYSVKSQKYLFIWNWYVVYIIFISYIIKYIYVYVK